MSLIASACVVGNLVGADGYGSTLPSVLATLSGDGDGFDDGSRSDSRGEEALAVVGS